MDMYEKKEHVLIIDPDFSCLLPPPDKKFVTEKENAIARFGAIKTVEAYHGIILYDFMYYDIYKRLHIPFSVREHYFPSREEAVFYACQQIMQHYDCNDIRTRYLIGKAFLCMKKFMVDVYAGRRENPFPDVDLYAISKTDRSRTSIIASGIFHVNPRTVSQYGGYAKAIDSLRLKAPDIADAILNKEILLSLENTIQLSKHMPSDISLIYGHMKNHRDTSLAHAEMKRRLDAKSSTSISRRRKPKVDAAIKSMPSFDPDAEINSLALTIPMWISSMKRTMDISNLSMASDKALHTLNEKLDLLSAAIGELKDTIKEENHEQ